MQTVLLFLTCWLIGLVPAAFFIPTLIDGIIDGKRLKVSSANVSVCLMVIGNRNNNEKDQQFLQWGKKRFVFHWLCKQPHFPFFHAMEMLLPFRSFVATVMCLGSSSCLRIHQHFILNDGRRCLSKISPFMDPFILSFILIIWSRRIFGTLQDMNMRHRCVLLYLGSCAPSSLKVINRFIQRGKIVVDLLFLPFSHNCSNSWGLPSKLLSYPTVHWFIPVLFWSTTLLLVSLDSSLVILKPHNLISWFLFFTVLSFTVEVDLLIYLGQLQNFFLQVGPLTVNGKWRLRWKHFSTFL